ncbi:MAG: hypothetical protein FD151_2401 [bacterium]|nr:MAG: hypothetical protein FD151_2401 [bacterium]
MIKKSSAGIQTILITLIFSLVIGPKSLAPKAVNDLKANIRERKVLLHWTIPDRNTDRSKLTNLAGFKVFRSKAPFEPKPCPNCPKSFEELADIEYRDSSPKNVSIVKKTMEFADKNLRYRTIYTYKVLSYNSDGIFSEDSNHAEISWDVPPLS